jgi:CSLREA domain-containing protein
VSLAFRRLSALMLLALLAAFAPLARPALAATLTVNSLVDPGDGVCNATQCTLREAINQANSVAGADRIEFSAAGAIVLGSALPALSSGNVTIDGTIPPNGTVPKIELRGNGTVAGQGILITSSGNTVRGLIISGFVDDASALDLRGAGIVISGFGVAAPSGNTIEYNYIGTNAAGTGVGVATNNNVNGGIVLEYGASGTTIQQNVISGNGFGGFAGSGIYLYTPSGTSASQQNNEIKDNKIGTNAAGTAAVPNLKYGIFVNNNSNSNKIGPNNLISGNGSNSGNQPLYGVFVSGDRTGGGFVSDNQVFGNKIGTNLSGTAAIPNTGPAGLRNAGVGVGRSERTLIGGTAANSPNVISGNSAYGVSVLDNAFVAGQVGTNAILVQKNIIGLNATQTGAVANGSGGVLLWSKASGVTVDGNVVSGNGQYGVRILGVTNGTDQAQQTRNNTIKANFIGTNSNGAGSLGNTQYGIMVQGATSGNLLDANRISNNPLAGISFEIDTSSPPLAPLNNQARNNTISGNGPNGIQLLTGSTGNIIGPANTITSHTNAGVTIQASQNTVKGNTIGANAVGVELTNAATGNTIGGTQTTDGNNINNNTGQGVLVQGAGTINNKISHTTTDGNGGKGIALTSGGNAPITTASMSVTPPSGLTLNGTVSGCTGACTVEIFTDDAPLTDEGPAFLISASVSGGAFTANIAGCKPYLIFTLTDGSSNTSEFRNPIGPLNQCVPAAPAVTITTDPPAPPRTIPAGSSTTYVHHVRNSGTGPGAVSVNFVTNNSWATLTGNTCLGQALQPNGTCDFSVQVNVPAGATAAQNNVSTITVNIGSASAQQVDTTNVQRTTGVTFTPDRTGPQTSSPGSVTYTHYLTNTGNAQDVFDLSGIVTTAGVSGVTFSYNPPSPITLAAGQGRSVQVTVNIPAGVTQPVVVTRITATSRNDTNTSDFVTENTPIQLAPVPQLTPATRSGSGKPGTQVVFQHTLANIGTASGNFSLAATGLPAGWTTTISPTNPIVIAAGASKPVTLTVTIPPGTSASPPNFTVTLTASVSGNTATSAAQDTITVLLAPGVDIAPDRSATAGPGQQIDFLHTLTNTGNGQDTFNLTVTPPAGWTFSAQPGTSITLPKGGSRAITISLTLPSGVVVSPPPYTTTVRAASASDASVSDVVTDTTTVVAAAVPRLGDAPAQSTNPGVGVTFTHAISNVGNLDGTFDLTLEGLPSGWTASALAPIFIAQSNSTSFTVTVTPTTNALAGPYTFTVRATDQAGINATDTAIDRVNVNQVARLTLGPDQSSTDPPNTVVTYTLTLANDGNFADTIGLAASSSRGWGVRPIPPSVTLGPGASQPVQVELTIPPGQVADLQNTTHVTATSSVPAVRDSALITTTIAAVPGVTLAPPSQALAVRAGEPVTFTYTLLNSGSISQTYTITRTNVPAGWTATISPTSPTALLAPNQSIPVQLFVTVPAGTPDGTVETINVVATSDTAPSPSDTAAAIVTVGPPFGVIIEPDHAGPALPGALVQYTHLVTNTGLFSDTFAISGLSPLGWEISAAPPSVRLEPGATAPVTVTVLVPTSADAGIIHAAIITARSTSQPTIKDQATDTATVAQVAGVSISPSRVTQTVGGELIRFQHVVLNTGNGADSFVISATQDLNWTITVVPTSTLLLPRGVSFPVEVRIQVPEGTPAATTNRITVRAVSAFDPGVSDRLLDVVGSQLPQNQDRKVYLPLVQRP